MPVNVLNRHDFSRLRNFYVMLMAMCLMARNIGVYSLLPALIDSMIFNTLAILGIFILAIDIAKGNLIKNIKSNYLLSLFLVVMGVSTILSAKYGIFSNLKEIVWTSITFFIIYQCVQNSDNPKNTEDIIIILQNLVILFFGMMSFLAMITAFLKFGQIFALPNGKWIGIGCVENRLFGLYVNPNSASIMAIIAAMFSVFQILKPCNKALKKSINIINIILQFLYLSFSKSRGSQMVALAVCAVFVFALVYKIINKPFNIIVFFKCFASSVLVCGILFLAMYFLIDIFVMIFGEILGARNDVVNNNDISNMRFELWLNGLEIFKNNWLFGVSPGNIAAYSKEVLPDLLLSKRNYQRLHSVWFGIPVYSGVLGAICFYTFLVKHFLNVLKYYLKTKIQKADPLFNLSVLIVFGICVYGLVESEILFFNSLCSLIFWVYLGFIANFSKSKTEITNL